jgi:hypothetical protein
VRNLENDIMSKLVTILAVTLIALSGKGFSQSNNLKECFFKAELKSIIKEKGRTFLVVRTTLTNQSKDTLKYHSDSCSWQDYYTVSNNKLQVQESQCDKYVPIILTLAPNQTKEVELRLILRSSAPLPIKFKVGFHLVQDRVYMDDSDVSQEFEKSVIWSDEISSVQKS